MAARSKLFLLFTNLSNKGRLVLLLAFILVLVLLLDKARQFDIVRSEPLFRRNFKRIASSTREFCLVSYNILADGPIRRNPEAYRPLSMNEKLHGSNPSSSPRHKQLMKELRWLNPDIINLQEVETLYFETLEKDLSELDFRGVHQVHRKGTNGLATFYNMKKFELKKSVAFTFNELLSKLFDLNQFKDNNKYNERVVLFSHLVEKDTGKPLLVANLHSMFASWTLPDMQALQIVLFFQKLHKFLNTEQEDKPLPYVISGDFNTYPHFPLYNIISTGNVSDEDMDRLNPNKYKYPQIFQKSEATEEKTLILKNGRKYLFHPLKDVKSAYKDVLGKEPPLTHYQINGDFPELYGFKVMKGTLDYIWYSSDTLRVNAVLEHVSEDVIVPLVACPNKFFPSDHLSMKACFDFKK